MITEPPPGSLVTDVDGCVIAYRELAKTEPWRVTGYDQDGPRDYYYEWEKIVSMACGELRLTDWDDL